MTDSKFKNTNIIFSGKCTWKRYSSGETIGNDGYRPDMSFKNTENNKVVCVIESSSTGDRKVGVGELLCADKFFADNEVSGILIFSLCGKSKYPPTPQTQMKYIEPYFIYLQNFNRKYGVKEVFLISEDDFESINYEALSDSFYQKSQRLHS